MQNYDYWKKSQITDISIFSYWLHQKGVGIYAVIWKYIFDFWRFIGQESFNSCRKNHFSTWCTRCSPLMYHRPWLVFLIFNHTFPVFYIPARRSRGGYIGILMSVCHTFAYRIIIKVPLNQIFSNFHTLLCTIKYRLRLITVYFTFTVSELWPFFS